MQTHYLQRLKNGDYVDLGRDTPRRVGHGYGPAKHYSGEAAKVIELVLKNTKGNRK